MMKFIRRFKDLAISDAQAQYYDKICREHRLEEIKAEAVEVAKQIKNGDSVLELACGPGYLSIELSKLGGFNLTGLDISHSLVEIAKTNAREAGAIIEFKQGNAAAMPFQADRFNFVVCVLAFKNFKAPLQALKEIYRVLKPNGSALILDLDRNSSLKEVKGLAEKMGLRGLNAYLAGAIQRSGAYTRQELEMLVSQTEFASHDVRAGDLGLAVYLRK